MYNRVPFRGIPFHRKMRVCKPLRARDAEVESFQAKVLIETLEHTCNKLVYDPKREYEYRMSLDSDDDDSIAILQLVMIACVGIGLCLLAQRK